MNNKIINYNSNLKAVFEESIRIKREILSNGSISNLIEMGEIASNAILKKKKILFCGNGGSAADSQHLAAELLIRLRPNYNREGIPAITLLQDTSTLTACGNDYGFNYLFERNLRTLGLPFY